MQWYACDARLDRQRAHGDIFSLKSARDEVLVSKISVGPLIHANFASRFVCVLFALLFSVLYAQEGRERLDI